MKDVCKEVVCVAFLLAVSACSGATSSFTMLAALARAKADLSMHV